MCTWPKGGLCDDFMTGFDYQAAAHMVAEGDDDLVKNGLAWGTYEQKDGKATIKITHGTLTLNEIDLGIFGDRMPKATRNGHDVNIQNLMLEEGDILELV